MVTFTHLRVQELIKADAEVKLTINKISTAMKAGSKKKWSLSHDVSGDLNGAKTGLQSKSGGRKTTRNLISNGNQRGWVETKGKQEFRDDLIKHKKELVGAMKNISKNILESRYCDEDYISFCIDYVKERFRNDYGERKRLRKLVEDNEKSFIRLWRVVIKRNLSSDETDRKFDEEVRDLEN